MKKIQLFIFVSIVFFLASFTVTAQGVTEQDSLALVDLYNSTNGAGWSNNTNWLSSSTVALWHGVTVTDGRVTALNLNGNGLNGNFPESITSITGLTQLSLSNNNLTGNIPFNIDTLINLKVLDLSANQMTGGIPAETGNLSNLNTLYLFSNKLSGDIPASLGNLSQMVLIRLNGNQLTGFIPSSFGNLSSLSELHLENNQLSGAIPGSLGKCANLTQLYLSDNRLTGSIPDSLCNAIKISRLVINNNDLEGIIPDSLSKLTQLFDLEFRNNAIKGPLPSLSPFLYLHHLYIDSNHFDFEGLENISNIADLIYAPQKSIALKKDNDILSVSAGGTITNDTFRLFKNGGLISTQTGDSIFSISGSGEYYISVTNRQAPQLTLFSDTLNYGIGLADTTTTVTLNLSGSSTTEVNDGNYKILNITPTAGPNELSGELTAMVTIDSTVSSFHDQPYVQRHYDITPSANPENAQATVTLYFTQQEFDNFNNYITANRLGLPLLPSGGVDNGNVRIIQLHGSFTASPNPANYADTTTIYITPEVSWDSTNNWWVVTFPVAGFSGFFVSTANFTLSVNLSNFEASPQRNSVVLQWHSYSESAVKEYVVERSWNVRSFYDIGSISKSSMNGYKDYDFTDTKPLNGDNYYRLKIVDMNGKVSYSNILLVKTTRVNLSLLVYPNPVMSTATLQFYTVAPARYKVRITNQFGEVIQLIEGVSVEGTNRLPVNLSRYSTGNYFIVLTGDGLETASLKVSRQ